MPVEHEQYYGFTQFAVELNELDSTLRPFLPPTDTRFRPDQRLALFSVYNVSLYKVQQTRIAVFYFSMLGPCGMKSEIWAKAIGFLMNWMGLMLYLE